MRIAVATFSSLLLVCSVSMAQNPVQQVKQDNADIRQLNTDVRNNAADVRKDSADVRYDQTDINRDRLTRSRDQQRENQDLARGDVKGAQYWNKQRLNENGEIKHDERNLAHSRLDVKNAKARLSKDVAVRHNDVVKRNRAAGKI
ncbi:MAG TPA: hypothetical protein VNZ06_05380 [Steroidobacteraceae bacterium]|jgi:hypothetical protein|nr:hypothetical protein [Steroidobacteraceae bacterium]